MNNTDLKKLISKQKLNYPLDQEFYVNDHIFDLDIKNIFSKQWVFVGHTSRIPNHGDYFLFNIAKESIIIVRDKDNLIHAHYNVCRHRGSQICSENEGNSKALICPYHAWTYNLDGSLRGARLMEKNFDKNQWSLHKCNLKIFEGLIFINLSDNPNNFDEFIAPTKKIYRISWLVKC